MNVLVTGASGFVGTRVVRQLSVPGSEYTVMPLRGDVRDAACHPREKFDAVIHLASLIPHLGSHTPAQFVDVNVGGTEQLLASYPAAHFVYVSTTDVERAKLSDYARSKLEAEKRVVQRASYCIVRLTSVFGPGQRQQSKLIPRLLRKYVFHEPGPELTNEARPCLYVDSAANAVCAGLKQRGIVTVSGTEVHNYDLERLVAAAVQGDALDTVSAAQQVLLVQLRECADYLRRQGLPQGETRRL
jgi:nucleoside-diphosphate-sugar epimerase